MTPERFLQLVQAMVAPAVMISACGLLLLGLTNKLGRIVDRIRDLNAEDRTVAPGTDPVRHQSIHNQIDQLVRRADLLKRSSGLLYLGVIFFVVTSLCIGLSNLTIVFKYLMLMIFVAGLVLVGWAGVLAYWEMHISHQVVVEEVRELRLRE
jgi:hypothetical protein